METLFFLARRAVLSGWFALPRLRRAGAVPYASGRVMLECGSAKLAAGCLLTAHTSWTPITYFCTVLELRQLLSVLRSRSLI